MLPTNLFVYIALVFPTWSLRAEKIEEGLDEGFVLGGLFPIHRKGTNDQEPCGDIIRDKGIQRLEAMLYAIDQINANASYWRFSLGAVILDTCSSDSYALEQSLNFLKVGCGLEMVPKRKVAGVVGAANSPVSESVANIFRLFKIPQVSYGSTSQELDNDYKFPYFFRVVPSDKFQIQLMFDILTEFRWTFVSAVASKGEYGEQAVLGLQDIIRNTTHEDICLATVETLPRNAKDEDYDTVIRRLLNHLEARAVIVFLNEDKVRQLLSASRRNNVSTNHFLWLGSDGWGAKDNPITGQEKYAEGAITLLPKRYPVKGFDEYFTSLKPHTNRRNPWFREYWESQFNCVFDTSRPGARGKKPCNGYETFGNSYRQEGLVPMVIDSVHVFAHALRSLCRGQYRICDNLELHLDGSLLKNSIANVSFNSSQGRGMVIAFDAAKHVPVNYTVYQLQKDRYTSKFVYKEIGEWNPTTRLKLREKPLWVTDEEIRTMSTCSESCGPGQERMRNTKIHPRCCWTCRTCEGETYLPSPYGHCTPCDQGTIPNSDRTSCVGLEPEYIGKNWNSPWTLVPFIFSLLGLLCTIVVFVIFVMHHKTPIIMASGRELCYVIFAGVACCYSFPFIAMTRPTVVTCGMVRVGMGLGLSICYSAIFTKTNRLSRIFNRSVRTAKRPAYISPSSQLTICLCLVLIQLTLTVMWLIVRPPSVKHQMMETPRAWVIICGVDGTSVMLGLLYNMLLIILCTVYAYKTRKIPENFNESKCISFTMYSSCIVWLAFIPIYCSTWQDYKVQSTILLMSVSITGGVILACIFLPKIHIVLFHPEKNVRHPSSSNSASATCTTSRPVRFVKPCTNTEAVFAAVHRSPKESISTQFSLDIDSQCAKM